MGFKLSGTNIRDAIKKSCTNKTKLSKVFKNTPEADYGLYTPEDPRNLCTDELLSSDEIKKHKENFCSLKPGHPVCPTTPTPTPSPTSTSTPTPSPTSTSTSTKPSSPTPSSSQNGFVMLLCSGITCLSCIMIVVIMVMMNKRSN